MIAEVALCFILLAGCGLMFRSFLALQRIDTVGEDFDGIAVLSQHLREARRRSRVVVDEENELHDVGFASKWTIARSASIVVKTPVTFGPSMTTAHPIISWTQRSSPAP